MATASDTVAAEQLLELHQRLTEWARHGRKIVRDVDLVIEAIEDRIAELRPDWAGE
jgi:hypothetical protein